MSQADLFDHFTAKPETLTWVIENFEKCSNHQSNYIRLSFGQALVLYLFPNEDVPHYYGKQVIIYFGSKHNLPTVYYRISVINENGQKWNTQDGRATIKDNSKDCTSSYIIKRDYLLDNAHSLLPNGKLTIYCEAFELNAVCINSGINRDNLVSLSQDNKSLLESGKLSDVVLVVGDRELKAHKLILSARSVVFEKMFEPNDQEESKSNRVNITDMSAGAAEDLLKFIYTGKVEDNFNLHVYELYAAADKYQIDSLKSYSELFLTMSLSGSTFAQTLQLADQYSLKDLKSKCINYITRHSAEFNLDDWKELITSRPELMCAAFYALGKKPM